MSAFSEEEMYIIRNEIISVTVISRKFFQGNTNLARQKRNILVKRLWSQAFQRNFKYSKLDNNLKGEDAIYLHKTKVVDISEVK